MGSVWGGRRYHPVSLVWGRKWKPGMEPVDFVAECRAGATEPKPMSLAAGHAGSLPILEARDEPKCRVGDGWANADPARPKARGHPG